MKTKSRNFIQLALGLAALALHLFVIQPAHAGTFSVTGSMNVPRRSHTATLLTNGMVLVTGGYDDGTASYLSSAELYDPATGTWTNTAAMTTARFGHTATLLTNGLVLVAGGGLDAELFNPATRTWTNTGAMNHSHGFHTATLLTNGLVLVAGGAYGGVTELFDPATRTWSTTGPTVSDHFFHTAALLPNGKVLINAGYIYDFIYNNTDVAELYDPVSGTWMATTPLPVENDGNDNHTATLLPNGLVLVAGGHSYNNHSYNTNSSFSSAELFNPSTGTWTVTNSMTVSRAYHAAALLNNGQVLVAGGYSKTNVLSSAELYDPDSGSWIMTNPMNTDRELFTATLLPSGKVLVAGGYSDSTNGTIFSAELYDPSNAIVLYPAKLPGGEFQFTFAGTPNMNFTVLATTNLSLALTNWTAVGGVIEVSSGHFQFTDPQATNVGQHFYSVRSP